MQRRRFPARCLSPIRRENLLLLQLARLQLRSRFLEFFVFDQLPDQIPARIVLVDVLLRRLLIDREQAAALQVNEVRRHDHELARNIDVQLLERLQILEVLLRDPLERDVVNIELVALDQVKQQIERSLENLEPDLVFGLHQTVREASGERLACHVDVARARVVSDRGLRSSSGGSLGEFPAAPIGGEGTRLAGSPSAESGKMPGFRLHAIPDFIQPREVDFAELVTLSL